MQVQKISLSREQAVSLNRDLSKVRKKVRLMERFDCEVVFRFVFFKFWWKEYRYF